MSSSHKKIIRRLRGIEENLNGLTVDQKVKIENNILGLCPSSSSEFEKVKNNMQELTNLIEGLLASASEISNLLSDIKEQLKSDLPRP